MDGGSNFQENRTNKNETWRSGNSNNNKIIMGKIIRTFAKFFSSQSHHNQETTFFWWDEWMMSKASSYLSKRNLDQVEVEAPTFHGRWRRRDSDFLFIHSRPQSFIITLRQLEPLERLEERRNAHFPNFFNQTHSLHLHQKDNEDDKKRKAGSFSLFHSHSHWFPLRWLRGKREWSDGRRSPGMT